MKAYSYTGPVEEFGKCINNKWSGTTVAPTPQKAKSNLAYQYKKEFNKSPRANITLPGKLKEE